MKILITGGCGFIGSNFVRYFSKKYPRHALLNVDKLTYAGNLENLHDLKKKRNYSFMRADICNSALMKKTFRKFKPDVVINFAAETHVDRSINAPSQFIKTNVLGVGVLLNLALECKIKKFIQISTDEVYGSITRGVFKESDTLTPSSPYAASKAGADNLVLAYHKTYQLPVLITRSTNNYGPYQFPEKLIPLVIMNALNKKPVPVYGDGMNVRDWIHVQDNCAAIDAVFHHGKIGEIYNIGGGNERTNLWVIREILKVLKAPPSLITFVKDRPGHDRRYALSTTSIKKLGWKPRISFDQGIQKTMKWYTLNQQWLRNAQTGAYRMFYKKYYSQLGLEKF